MEIVGDCSESLCNRQVLDILKNYTSKKQTNLATILYEITSYLESSLSASSSMVNIAAFLDILKEKHYDLTKMEKIQLVNLKPQNETELHLIIDNIEDKLTEEQRGEILELIRVKLNHTSNDDSFDSNVKKIKV